MKNKNRTPTPHDATFRQFLTQPEIARDFMGILLPTELRAISDVSTMKLESSSFVEDDLHQYFSDVLYSLKTATSLIVKTGDIMTGSNRRVFRPEQHG